MSDLRVIIVEDSDDDAALLLSQLQAAGYNAVGPRVENEADFLTALQDSPDIIFSDYSMPNFSGLRALEITRTTAPQLPFILISGTVGEEIAVQSMLLGATDYLLKDNTIRLASAVKRALDEKHLRDEQAKAVENLRLSEERFRAVVENIREVFWVSDDKKSTIYYISPGYERIWGLPCDTIYANALSWLDLVHQDDRDRVRQNALTQQVSGQYNETYRIIRPDGDERWIRDRAFPIIDADGQVRRIVGIAEDISDQKRLEEQLRHAQKMEAIGQLAGGVAHDFNNILQAMMMQIDLALHRVAQDGTRQLLLGLQQSAERASHLTQQLLTFGRKTDTHMRKLDLNSLVLKLIEMLERVVGEQVEIVQQIHDSPLIIVGDSSMLEQVLMSVVVNSRDAMPGGGKLKIATSVERHDGLMPVTTPAISPGWYARLTVEDTGTGISPEDMPRIFEPFFTTKASGQATGLGLPVAFGIVQQHSGGLRVSSTPAKGTRVDVLLPLATPSSEDEPILHKQKILPGRGTVLIVEDESEVRKLTQMLLERNGYKVFTANNGEDALNIFSEQSGRIDVLLTDIVMPGGMDGRQLAESIQQKSPRVRVILATGYNAPTTSGDKPQKAGQVILRKPFKSHDLLDALRKATQAQLSG